MIDILWFGRTFEKNCRLFGFGRISFWQVRQRFGFGRILFWMFRQRFGSAEPHFGRFGAPLGFDHQPPEICIWCFFINENVKSWSNFVLPWLTLALELVLWRRLGSARATSVDDEKLSLWGREVDQPKYQQRLPPEGDPSPSSHISSRRSIKSYHTLTSKPQ